MNPEAALTQFEGRDVTSAGIEIPGAAGGLREALGVDPVELHLAQEVYVVLRLRTRKIRFDPQKRRDDDDESLPPLMRVHVMEVQQSAFVDGATVVAALEAQQRRIDEAKGQGQLPLTAAETVKLTPEEEQRLSFSESAGLPKDDGTDEEEIEF